MPPLPKATCPVCTKTVALRVTGQLREHHIYRAQRDQRPGEHLGRMKLCPGSGMSGYRRREIEAGREELRAEEHV